MRLFTFLDDQKSIPPPSTHEWLLLKTTAENDNSASEILQFPVSSSSPPLNLSIRSGSHPRQLPLDSAAGGDGPGLPYSTPQSIG
jgi:hypothetical protein